MNSRYSLGVAEAHDSLDAGAIVPGAVEEHDLAAGRQMRDIALEIPLRTLALVRLFERHDAGAARVEMLHEALDRAALAGGVAALEQHDDLLAALLDPVLRLQEFGLQRQHALEIVLLRDLGRVGIIAGLEGALGWRRGRGGRSSRHEPLRACSAASCWSPHEFRPAAGSGVGIVASTVTSGGGASLQWPRPGSASARPWRPRSCAARRFNPRRGLRGEILFELHRTASPSPVRSGTLRNARRGESSKLRRYFQNELRAPP